MTPGIACVGLVKRYGDVTAVAGLSLAVAPGTVYGLLGPDGAGKTSALRCLAGSAAFDAGEVRICGHDALREPDTVRPLIGYVPQRFSLYPDLTVAENMRFFADLYGVPPAHRERRMAELLAFTRLKGHEGKLAGFLSGGMKQKLALAVALVHRPPVLLLDEPSTGVDPVSRREYWSLLLSLKREGVAILVTTPYMDEAEKCDRIGMLAHGRLLAEGTPASLKAGFPYQVVRVAAAPLLAARRALQGEPWVRTAVIHGDAVHVVVDDAAEAARRIPPALAAAGVACDGVEPVAPSLEDVMVHAMVTSGLATPAAARGEGGDRGRRH